jgi:hypothetical protein
MRNVVFSLRISFDEMLGLLRRCPIQAARKGDNGSE